MACGAPRKDSKVRRIRSSRAWVMTWMQTSSGMRRCSMSWRTKSKSVCEAEGNATSISLKPSATSRSKNRALRSAFMGSIKAWLPSRRSVEHQRGARVSVRAGHWRSGRDTAGKGRYLFCGRFSMSVLQVAGSTASPRSTPRCAGAADGRRRETDTNASQARASE